jgi:hypothetical protein
MEGMTKVIGQNVASVLVGPMSLPALPSLSCLVRPQEGRQQWTAKLFSDPSDLRTMDCVNGRFG